MKINLVRTNGGKSQKTSDIDKFRMLTQFWGSNILVTYGLPDAFVEFLARRKTPQSSPDLLSRVSKIDVTQIMTICRGLQGVFKTLNVVLIKIRVTVGVEIVFKSLFYSK